MVTGVGVYLGLLGLLAAERVVELAVSRRNARRAFARGGREVGASHFRAMATLHTLFLGACALEVLACHRAFPGALGFVALGAALLAQALRQWAIATLGDRWNVRVIVVPSAPPVTSGPYRFVRHPNYLAVVIELAAVPAIHGAWITSVVFTLANALLLGVRIRVEEAALGGAWAAAFAGRPRLLPRAGVGAGPSVDA